MIPPPWTRRLKSARRAAQAWLARPGVIGPVTGGVLLLTFPPLEWSLLAWVALAPLLAVLEGEGDPARRRGARAWFGGGWGLGLVLCAGNYHWLFRALLEIGGVPPWRFVPFWLALLATLALGPALALAACAWARARLGWGVWWTAPLAFMLVDAAFLVLPFGGVAWGSWAATQTETSAAAWIAPVLGGPGVVAALVAVNAGWAALLDGRGRARRGLSPAAGAAALAVATAVLIWPGPPPDEAAPAGGILRALLVPADLPASAEGERAGRLRHFIARTLAAAQPGRRAARSGGAPLLVVWPETAAAEDVTRGKTLVEIHDVATLVDGDIVLGSDIRERGRARNSLFLVQGGRFEFQRYDKRRLVPFGEYVPLGFRALFGRKATVGDEDDTPGEAPPVLPWRGKRLGVAICFESILPEHVALAVRHGAQALVVIANDAWLTPAARTHHLRLTALRAMEAGRDAVFVSNGGWTARLSHGQALQAVPAYGEPVLVEARLRSGETPWVRWGLALPLLAALLALVARAAVHGVALWARAGSGRLRLP